METNNNNSKYDSLPPTSSSSAVEKCGLLELLLFLAAIVCGTACSLCSKIMMGLHSTGITGQEEVFTKPIFQTFGMFVGMTFGLVMHWAVVYAKVPFPGYEHDNNNNNNDPASQTVLPMVKTPPLTTTTAAPPPTPSSINNNKPPPSPSSSMMARKKMQPVYGSISTEEDHLLPSNYKQLLQQQQAQAQQGSSDASLPLWMYFFLAIPSVFDLGATALCMMGLRYLDVSIYQLLRGSGIIFVALMKQHFLGDRLYKFQWIGVAWNVISVFLVGSTAILNSSSSEHATVEPTEALLGVVLVMAGAFVQSLQFVFEEKVMTMDESAVPPLLLIGMEGLWGTFLCLTIVYPIAYFMPGDDHGSYEDPYNTYEMIWNSSTIQWAFVIYFFAIFGYNLFAVLVTFMLNSIWHAILDNFRPVTVWCTDMFIFYVITSNFGEPWTKYSWIQLLGMFVLLYGTAVYNAPNAGSVRLQGQWFHFGVDFSDEYVEVELEIQQAEADALWEQRRQEFVHRRGTHSFAEQRTPLVSVHTQSLRGLASPKI